LRAAYSRRQQAQKQNSFFHGRSSAKHE
jgi:hypothetical protein